MSKPKQVSFNARIWKVSTKSLASGDKATRLTLDFDSNDKNDVLNAINDLHRADREVAVGIVELVG